MYLPPLMYQEGFATYQDNFLPFARNSRGRALGPALRWRGTTTGSTCTRPTGIPSAACGSM